MKYMIYPRKQHHLFTVLVCLTILFIAAQLAFFIIHYHVSAIVDSIEQSSISSQLFHPNILLPIALFMGIEFVAYALFVTWIWFMAVSIGQLRRLTDKKRYRLGLRLWCYGCLAILTWNNYLYPHSFFATLLQDSAPIYTTINFILLILVSLLLIVAMAQAFLNYLYHPQYRSIGHVFIVILISIGVAAGWNRFAARLAVMAHQERMPNIILIGLDSLRPDFTGYFNGSEQHTPHIDEFLRNAAVFTDTYTPLARTFPSWVSILTAQHPKHSSARINLMDPRTILAHGMLAKRLQQAGYATIFGMDERRFAHIDQQYGFDRIIGPKSGAVEFILAGMSDFPLHNLLVNLPLGKFLFPYNYGNRAANITYEPEKFMQLVRMGLARRQDKPLFLAIHLCVTHWPFSWARDQQTKDMLLPDRYRSSVAEVDAELGELLQLLQQEGLLEHSIVFLLSDHGTSMGLPNDRIVTKENYQGDPEKMKLLTVSRFSRAPEYSLDFARDYSINTVYGQGTDVLSLKQYHTLLAVRGFGVALPVTQIHARTSLMDIAPTILDWLKLAPLSPADGQSLLPYLRQQNNLTQPPRPIFIETGDSIAEIETDHIQVDRVINKSVGAYRINLQDGHLFVAKEAQVSVLKSKQRALLWGDWLLARYPERGQLIMERKKSPQAALKSVLNQPFYVLANIKTGQWTLDLSSPLAGHAPLAEMMSTLKAFYGDEIGANK